MPLVAFLATKINKEQHPHPHGVGGGKGRGGKGRGGGQLPPPGKLNGFFCNIVFEVVGPCLVAILVRNLKNAN